MDLDIKTLIHVGTELIIITGLTFWMNKRMSEMEKKIQALENGLTSCFETIKKQNELLSQHEQVFRQLFGGGSSLPPPATPQKGPESPVSSPVPMGEPPQEKPKKKSKKSKPKKKDLSPEDIDRLIKEEMEKEMNNEILIETIDEEEMNESGENTPKTLKHKKKEM